MLPTSARNGLPVRSLILLIVLGNSQEKRGSETFVLCHLITSSLGHVVILDCSAEDFEKSSVSHSCLQAPHQTIFWGFCQTWSDGLFQCVFTLHSDKSDSTLSVGSMKRVAFHSVPYLSSWLLSGWVMVADYHSRGQCLSQSLLFCYPCTRSHHSNRPFWKRECI